MKKEILSPENMNEEFRDDCLSEELDLTVREHFDGADKDYNLTITKYARLLTTVETVIEQVWNRAWSRAIGTEALDNQPLYTGLNEDLDDCSYCGCEYPAVSICEYEDTIHHERSGLKATVCCECEFPRLELKTPGNTHSDLEKLARMVKCIWNDTPQI